MPLPPKPLVLGVPILVQDGPAEDRVSVLGRSAAEPGAEHAAIAKIGSAAGRAHVHPRAVALAVLRPELQGADGRSGGHVQRAEHGGNQPGVLHADAVLHFQKLVGSITPVGEALAPAPAFAADRLPNAAGHVAVGLPESPSRPIGEDAAVVDMPAHPLVNDPSDLRRVGAIFLRQGRRQLSRLRDHVGMVGPDVRVRRQVRADRFGVSAGVGWDDRTVGNRGRRHESPKRQRAELHAQIVRIVARPELEIDPGIPTVFDLHVSDRPGPVSLLAGQQNVPRECDGNVREAVASPGIAERLTRLAPGIAPDEDPGAFHGLALASDGAGDAARGRRGEEHVVEPRLPPASQEEVHFRPGGFGRSADLELRREIQGEVPGAGVRGEIDELEDLPGCVAEDQLETASPLRRNLLEGHVSGEDVDPARPNGHHLLPHAGPAAGALDPRAPPARMTSGVVHGVRHPLGRRRKRRPTLGTGSSCFKSRILEQVGHGRRLLSRRGRRQRQDRAENDPREGLHFPSPPDVRVT